jgi:S1-C subfamily serine protease
VLPSLVLGLALPAARAADTDASDGKVYQGLLPSTVWVNLVKKTDPSGKTEFLSGTGELIDLKQRLVLTGRHVVRDKEDAYVLFPAFQGKRLVRERRYYSGQILHGVPGKVIARDARHDLALIQLAALPPGARALRLAAEDVTVGDHVYSLGNPGDSEQLWVFRPGAVQKLVHEKFRSKTNDGFESEVDSDIILTDAPNRPGESGGPLVNEHGELAGVIHGDRSVKTGNKETHYGLFIDLKEVRGFLESNKVALKPARPAAAPPAAPRVQAPVVTQSLKPAETADDLEETAARRLKLARGLVQDGFTDKAADRLQEIIKQFPKTRAAGEARELLGKLSK